MENQERHKQKIDILAKCIDAHVITLQEALMLLDADIVQPEINISSSSTQWGGLNYPPRTYNYPGTGTITVPNLTFGTSTGGTTTTTTLPQGATLTNTVGSINENTD
jgi:hypothetical protein